MSIPEQAAEICARLSYDIEAIDVEGTCLAIVAGVDATAHVSALAMANYVHDYLEWWTRQ